MSATAVEPLATKTVLDRVGGVRGMIDGGLPPLVFVVLNTAARVSMAPTEAVRLALAGALVTGAVIIVVRRAQAQTLRQAMRGLAGLAVAALFAVFSGQARDFFLPGMVVDAAYAVAFAVSALIGRPLVGAIYRLVSGRRIPWRDDPATRRVFTVATVGWALVYTVRAGVQIVFYRDDHPTLLAVSKLVLGWPLTAVAVVLTLAYLRRTLVTTGSSTAETGRPIIIAKSAATASTRFGARVAGGDTRGDFEELTAMEQHSDASVKAGEATEEPPHQPRPGENRDVVIVGSGQAGLATAFHLRNAGIDVAAYLAEYATRFGLPVRTGAEVVGLTGREGAFAVHLATGETIGAGRVVVATGAFGRPYTPAMAAGLRPHVVQVHTYDYRNPSPLPSGPVLVVGGGNSGFQVAEELARSGRRVHLAEGNPMRTVPQRIAGRDLFWWLTTTRAIDAPAHTRVGRRLRANEPVIGTSRRSLRRAGVTFHPWVVSATGTTMAFQDGTFLQPAAVVWATGYRHDDSWITLAGALDATGALASNGADTPVKGLHVIGRPWQRDRGSSLLGYVQHDAERLAQRLVHSAPAGVGRTHARNRTDVS